MDHFQRRGDGELCAEDVPLREIAAAVGTPTYVYSAATLTRHYTVFDAAWAGVPHVVCYAVKACSNLAVLNLLARLGAGFDIVSAGELHRVIRAGGDLSKVVFSGVGKRREEIALAIDAGILCLNVESEAELLLVDAVAREVGRVAPISLRVNPDVDAGTHPYIATGLRTSKFGIDFDQALRCYRLARDLPGVEIRGLDCHIGSQLQAVAPLEAALDKLLELMDALAAEGITLAHLDVGGGLGISYDDEAPPSPAEYGRALSERLEGRDLTVVLEPGRVIAGNAGVLLMEVLLNKRNGDKRFVVVDAAMNDAIRPTLYGAFHAIEPVGRPADDATTLDVVGPVCETGDFLARDRELPLVTAGDLLAMRSAGAYGFAMASNYNSRTRPAEVLVQGDRFHVVRERETLDDLWRGETIPRSG